MCYNKTELFAQNIDIVLGSIVSTVGKVYVFVYIEIGSSIWPLIALQPNFEFKS